MSVDLICKLRIGLMDAKPDRLPFSRVAVASGGLEPQTAAATWSVIWTAIYIYRMSLTNRQLNNQMTSAPANDIVTIATNCTRPPLSLSLTQSFPRPAGDVHCHVTCPCPWPLLTFSNAKRGQNSDRH